MKKRVTSLLLAAVMAVTSVPTVGAVGGFDFMNGVQSELPAQSGVFLGETPALPKVGGTDFMKKLNGDLPEVRKDGFLAEPTAPLKTFPEEGLMAEISAPDENAIEIDSVEDLALMADGGSFVLTADLDLSGIDWTPIDTGYESVVLDGQGHTISGLTFDSVANWRGLFLKVYGLTVRNLRMEDVTANGVSYNMGALAGEAYNEVTLENCVLDGMEGSLTEDSYDGIKLGGFIGYINTSENVVLRDCAVRGTYDLNAVGETYVSYGAIGGIAGSIRGKAIEVTDCLTNLDMTFGELPEDFTGSAGGLAGGISASGDVSVLRCVSSGDAEGQITSYSGLASVYNYGNPVTFEDCLFNGSAELTTQESTDHESGGLASSVSGSSVRLINCRSEGSISVTEGGVGGLVGRLDDRGTCTVIRHCLADSDIEAGNHNYVIMGAGGLVGAMDHTFLMEECLATGTVAMTDGSTGSTKAGGMVGFCYGTDSTLLRCVSESTVSGTYVGGMVGENDRDNPVIFEECSFDGTVTGIFESTNSGSSTAGGFLGQGFAAIENCVAGGTVTGDYAGGLLGLSDEYLSRKSETTVTNCRVDCTVDGEIVGGMVGAVSVPSNDDKNCYASFTNCAAAVELISDEENDQIFGGLLGRGQGDAERCRTEIDIIHTGDAILTAGGLVGKNLGEVVLWDSKTSFKVDDRSSKNGILGGVIGVTEEFVNYDALITNCVSEVDICAGVKAIVGGIAGKTRGVMTLCTATGTIKTANGQKNAVDNGAIGGLIGRSYKLIVGECCASVDIDAKNGVTDIGGLIGRAADSTTTIYSCWSDADISFIQNDEEFSVYGSRGGLIGTSGGTTAASLAMQDCCFLGTLTGHLGEDSGGLVGKVQSGVIRNCYAAAEISGAGRNVQNSVQSQTGGIAGYMKGSIQNCYFSGSVTNDGGIVGGIVGNDKNGGLTMSGCKATGTFTGSVVGGIVGKICGTVRDCTFDGVIRLCDNDWDQEDGDAHYLGGIAGVVTNGTISNCTVEQRLNVSKTYFYGDTLRFSPDVYLGGIAGKIKGQIGDCVTNGATARITNASVVYVGGIAAMIEQSSSTPFYLDSCTVNSGVMGTLTGNFPENLKSHESVYVGGLIAAAGYTIKMGGCTVNGSVTAALSRSHSEMGYTVKAGGLVGSCYYLYPEACEFNGALIYPVGLGNLSTPQFLPLLGSGTLKGASAPEVTLPEREEEDYKITVYGYTMQDLNGYLLPNAGIYVNGTGLGRTNEFGEFTFSSEVLDQHGINTITVSHSDYFESTHYTYLAREGNQTFWLKKKEPGQIYFKTVQYQEEHRANLLNRLDAVSVLQQDTERKKVEIRVDWNNIDDEGREVYLQNQKGNRKYALEDGMVNEVRFASAFKPEDEIYIVAKGTYEGQPVEAKEKLSISIKAIDVEIKVDKGKQQVGSSSEADEDSNLYFLQGLKLDMGFGDLVPFASDISVLNEELQLKFTWKQGESDTMDFWKLDSGTGTLKKGVDVFVEGTLKIPITDEMEREWSGDVTFGINQLPDIDYAERASVKASVGELESDGLLEVTIPLPLPVPSYFETKIGVGGSGTLRIYGPYDKVNVAGKTTVSGYGMIGIGVGGEVNDNLEVKVGGEGELRADISMVHDPAAGEPLALDPVIDGAVSAKATLKAYIINGEVKLKLGGFHWDKEKLQWFALDNEGVVATLAEEEVDGDWQAVSRNYLANGGGFRTEDAALWGFRTESGAKVRYENIALTADSALALNSAGNAVLYYTADDESAGSGGTVAGHTVLWMSEQAADGSWSKPEQISTDGAYPAVPHASGDYVIWVESEETDSLDEMLTSTVIKLAKNGKVVATYDPGCYAYDPQVAASSDGSNAVISWMQDSTISGENVLGGSPVLYYAAFDGTSIGTPQTKKDTSSAKLVYNSTLNNAVIRYVDASGGLYRNYSYVLMASMDHYATDGSTTVNINDEGKLTIYNGSNSTAVKSFDTSFSGTGGPVLVTDSANSQKYIFWAENGGIGYVKGNWSDWSEPVLLTETNAAASQLAAVVDANGKPHLSWIETSVDADGTERTDLYTMTLDPTGIDLVLEELSYDEDHLLDTGEIQLTGKVYNNSLNEASGMQVTITDENGKTVYTNSFTRPVAASDRSAFYAVFAPDGKSEHTYTVSVEPVLKNVVMNDTDTSDNTLEIGVSAGAGEIVDLGFVQSTAAKTVTLQALVRNTGGAEIESMQVTVTDESGETVAEEIYTELPFGSTCQLLMANVTANERYTVTVVTDGEETDERTLVYTDPDAPRLSVSVPAVSGKTAELTLRGQGQTEGEANIKLALYQNGRMRYAAEDTVDSLNSSEELKFVFEKAPAAGTYDYKIFFLRDDGTFAPLTTARTGSVTVK